MAVTWQTPPNLFVNVVQHDLDRVYRTFIMVVYSNLVMLSPVDTGRYRNNHHISIGSPSYSVYDNTRGVAMQLPPTGTYPTIYIQNNLPYALRLEHGHSKQAPTGVFHNAFMSAVATIGV